MEQRKRYTAQYKRDAVRQILEDGRTITEVSRELGISYNVLNRWKLKVERRGEHAFPGHGHAEVDEVTRLRRELEKSREENEILKKAVGIFSRQPR